MPPNDISLFFLCETGPSFIYIFLSILVSSLTPFSLSSETDAGELHVRK